MKTETIKGKDHKELKELLATKKAKLVDFRFNISSGQIKNVKEGRGLRKEIAQIMTELNVKA